VSCRLDLHDCERYIDRQDDEGHQEIGPEGEASYFVGDVALEVPPDEDLYELMAAEDERQGGEEPLVRMPDMTTRVKPDGYDGDAGRDIRLG
jgi:hypothetical protein